jgi:hypothetical protein
MKYLTVEERLAEELIGPWHAVADELKMTPDEYKAALSALFQSEDDAGVQMRWGEVNLSGTFITFTFEYSDTTLNSEFELPALPNGWNYRLLEGNVKRHRVAGKFTGRYVGELTDGKFTVSLAMPRFGSPGFNIAQFELHKTLNKEVLRCLANRLH